MSNVAVFHSSAVSRNSFLFKFPYYSIFALEIETIYWRKLISNVKSNSNQTWSNRHPIWIAVATFLSGQYTHVDIFLQWQSYHTGLHHLCITDTYDCKCLLSGSWHAYKSDEILCLQYVDKKQSNITDYFFC